MGMWLLPGALSYSLKIHVLFPEQFGKLLSGGHNFTNKIKAISKLMYYLGLSTPRR